MAERKRLGRGLSALLGEDSNGEVADIAPATSRAGREVPIESLHPGRYQPRRHIDEAAIDELSSSIKDKGVLQPILVRRDPEDANAYEIIAGERRWRAAQLAGLHEVPVVIKELTDQETLEVALIENLQREDLSPLEEAQAYQRLMNEFSHTQDALAKALGKSRSHVANTVRLLALPDAVKTYLEDGRLTAGHARALLGQDNAADLAKQIVTKGLNVRQTEALVSKKPAASKPGGSSSSAKPGSKKDADTVALEQELADTLGLKVEIDDKGGHGVLALHYSSLDELDALLSMLSRSAIAAGNAAAAESSSEAAPATSETSEKSETPKLSVSLKPKASTKVARSG